MRLLQEEEPHLLPDSQTEQLPPHLRILKRALIQLFTVEGLTIAVGVLLTVLLTVVLSLNYLDVSRNVKNGLALRDFHAEFEMQVVDTDATQRSRDRAKQSVEPVYQADAPHNQDILKQLQDLLDDVGDLLNDNSLSESEKVQRFQQLTGNPQADAFYKNYMPTVIATGKWNRLTLAANQSMRKILAAGLTETAYQENRETIIRRALPKYGFSSNEKEVIFFLLTQTLQPNRIVDDVMTGKAREKSAAGVADVMRSYKQGEKIVGRGETVTPLQLAALEKMGKSVHGNNWLACVGILLLATLFVSTAWYYLYHFQDRTYFRPGYASLMSFLVLVTVIGFELLAKNANGDIPLYAFPMAAFAMTVTVFTHPRIGTLSTTLLVFVIGLALQADFYSLSVLLFGSFMGIYILNRRVNFSDRGQMMYAGLYVSVTNAIVLLALSFLRPGMGTEDNVNGLLPILAWGFAGGIVSGILTVGCLPLLESIFRLVTPFKLMELGNYNAPLLKRLSFEAPGTFHHSQMVASLAEAAAEAIGANPLLTRVGCLYHDIGKMKRPLFFIENQAYFGSENPHDKLTPRLSKMVITAHPRDSLEMAKQYRLPEVLMKFMTEHHGTLTAGYFYNKACIEEGVENVNKSQFRYPGPKPNIKETAIVMVADACESAVRAMKNPSIGQVEERIDKIIQQRVEDGQFDNCPITFKDISIIRSTFLRVFRGQHHNRIEYQQNIMRELGRKTPAVDTAAIQQAVAEVQAQAGAQTGAVQVAPAVGGEDISPNGNVQALHPAPQSHSQPEPEDEPGGCC